MEFVDPTSESEVLRSSVILLIRLHDIRFGPWEKEKDGDLLVSIVTMKLVIEEVLRGKVSQNVGEAFEFTCPRRSTGSSRKMDNYGLWSMVSLSEGIGYVAFCHGASDDATVLLTEENCEQLVNPDPALEDTRAAIKLEEEDSPTGVLSKAASLAEKHGDIFARYVAARTKRLAISVSESVSQPAFSLSQQESSTVTDISSQSDDAFESLMTILEDPKTTRRARAAFLTSIYEEITLMAAPPLERVTRFVLALFKLLASPESEPLHDSIKEVYLPNLLGLKNPPLRYSAAEIFPDRADERLAILSLLKQAPEKESVSRLIQWLEEKET